MGLGVLIDIAVSVLAVVALFALATTAINEMIADNLMRLRARTLEAGLRSLLRAKHLDAIAARHAAAEAAGEAAPIAPGPRRDDRLLDWALGRFYDDPDIRALMEGARRPSAIEPRRYALTLLAVLGRRAELETAARGALEARRADTLAAITQVAEAIGASGQGAALAAHADAAFSAAVAGVAATRTALDEAVAALEREFAETMDRVSGWYLRRMRLMSLLIGLSLAAGANVDLLRYADRLMTEANVRERAAAHAQLLADDQMLGAYRAALTPMPGEDPDAALGRQMTALLGQLEGLDVQIGWRCAPVGPDAGPLARAGCGAGMGLVPPSPAQVVGWLLVAFGVTLGAQFWFDLLRRVVGLRMSGRTRDA